MCDNMRSIEAAYDDSAVESPCTNDMKESSNLKLWQEYGDHLLVVQPFMDSLIVSGDGCYLIDAEGRRILDMAAGQFCSILGHSHPRFIERLKQQLDSALHIGDQYVSPGVLAAASRLAGITPGNLNKVFFCKKISYKF